MKQLTQITLSLFFILPSLFSFMNASAKELIIDNRSTGNTLSNMGSEWRLVTDGVMGGVSKGNMSLDKHQDKQCLRMTGQVSTENNGGFIQMALDLNDGNAFDASRFEGLELLVAGNNEVYNLHYRTSGLWMPWQSYRASFKVTPEWGIIKIPFNIMTRYKTSKKFKPKNIKRFGLVAIGKEFTADLCVASVRFYGKQ